MGSGVEKRIEVQTEREREERERVVSNLIAKKGEFHVFLPWIKMTTTSFKY